LPEQARFCPNCGTPRDSSRGESGERLADERIALLGRYLPKALVRHLMVEREAPVGQQAVAAVVFADVSGFTAMSEKMDPEHVLGIMNGCFEGLVEAVERHGGVVDKFIGDCVMAVFGVPAAHQDDAARAVRACREMFDYLEQYNHSLSRPLGLSVGINYGPLVAGYLGSKLRMDYTVMGATVNLAQRLEAAATSGQVLVSEFVKRAAESEIEFEPLKPIKVKGIEAPVQVYLAKDDLEKPIEKISLPCVGRDKHVDGVESALNQAGGGALAIDLYGTEGMGKTRIAEEVAARWAKGGPDGRGAFIARAPGYGRERPFGAIGALVEAVCGIETDDPPTRRAEKLTRLHDFKVSKGWHLFLKYVTSSAAVPMGDLDGVGIEAGVLAATRSLFQSLASAGHLVVLDGHERFDSQSLQTLARLWPREPPPGLRLIATRTSSAKPLFSGSGWVRSAEVGALDKTGAGALASARLSLEAIPQSAELFLFGQSGGNPRYLLELIESLIETGHVYSSDAGYIVRDDLASAGGGLSLISLVKSRIDRLPADRKFLLQAGALYGISFPMDVVSEAVGQTRAGPQWLSEMASRGLLTGDGTWYTFTHAMVHNLAVESLLSDQRRDLLTRLGAALEAHSDGFRDESLPLLARFFADGEDLDKAVYYLERGGDYQMKNGEFITAAESYEKLSEKQSARGAVRDSVARAGLMAARAWEQSGQMRKAFHWYVQAEMSAAQAGSSLRLAQARRHVARMHRLQGAIGEARASVDSALSASREARDARNEAWSLLEAAEIELADQQNQAAEEKLEQAQKIAAGLSGKDDEGSVRGRSLSRLGRLALTGNDFGRAMELLEEAASVCEAAGDSRELVRLHGNLGALCHGSGKDGARVYFERAIGLARKIGDKMGEAKQLHNLGSFLSTKGERDEALKCYNLSYDLARALEWMEGVAVNANAIKQLERQASGND